MRGERGRSEVCCSVQMVQREKELRERAAVVVCIEREQKPLEGNHIHIPEKNFCRQKTQKRSHPKNERRERRHENVQQRSVRRAMTCRRECARAERSVECNT